jgi:hypothetical protein
MKPPKNKRKMLHARASLDPILAAVLSEIHKTAEKPGPGFLTRQQWMKKWGFKCHAHTGKYIEKAIKMGLLISRKYRVLSCGRLVLLEHYGPPGRVKAY